MTAVEPPTLESVHDFASKLLQPGMRATVVEYLRWRKAARSAAEKGESPPAPPDAGPLSINLDLTTACNYACDHCIDWDSLNSPIRHDSEALKDSLRELARRGMQSVILIGGGEPTVYPGFSETVKFLKSLGLQVAVVTNGSRNGLIAEVATTFTAGDWVRLSLDAGSDATFQAMHKPKVQGLTLDAICDSARSIKERNPAIDLGFSFVITWNGTRRDDVSLVENLDEMSEAAERAKNYGFDYISFKPYLMRAPSGAEVLDASEAEAQHAEVIRRVRENLASARRFQEPSFRVLESTNLRVLLDGTWREYTDQPRECHMQALRQVVSPLGVFNCPAHRGVDKARIGDKTAWSAGGEAARAGTASLIAGFDAHAECREVTCLYNPVNRFLETVIETEGDPESILGTAPDRADAFL